MSKYIIAGEPLKDFAKRQGNGVWLVSCQENANKLQRHLGAIACRKKLKVECKTMPTIIDDKVFYVLMAALFDPTKLVEIPSDYKMPPTEQPTGRSV